MRQVCGSQLETSMIKAFVIADQSFYTFVIEHVWVDGTLAFARLPNSSRVAELNLEKPQDGWRIYPD